MGSSLDSHTDSVAVVRVKLVDAEPVDGRKPFAMIAVESNQSLSQLASIILASFGFDSDRCYGFYSDLHRYTHSEERYELFADIGQAEGPGVENVSIAQVFTPGRQMLFLFDYGDQWHFIVRLVRFEDAVRGQRYPALLRSHAIPVGQYYDEWSDDDDFMQLDDDGAGADWTDGFTHASGSNESATCAVPTGVEPTEPPYEPPTTEQWADLYDAAVAFRDSRCYQWVDDTQLFGVLDPTSGSVWYCSILGNVGRVFGLAAYEGSAGLAAFLESMEPDARPELIVGPNSPRSLVMFLGDRNMLDADDLKVIKSIGLRFRGPHQWPYFRSVLPGYRPWYLTSDEAVTMKVLVEQALEVARELLRNPDHPLRKLDWEILTRVPRSKKGSGFMDAYRRPDLEPQTPASFDVPMDDLKIHRYRRDFVRSKCVWEISAKWVQEPMRERPDSRPFYPIMLVWVDRTNGLVLSARLTNLARFPEEIVNSTLECMEQHATIPKEIEVDSADAMLILGKLAQRMGLQLRQVDQLRKSDMIREELYGYLKRSE